MPLQRDSKKRSIQWFFLLAILGSFVGLHYSFGSFGSESHIKPTEVSKTTKPNEFIVRELGFKTKEHPIHENNENLLQENHHSEQNDKSTEDDSSINTNSLMDSKQEPESTAISITASQLAKWDPKLKYGQAIHRKLIDSWGIKQSDELDYASYQIGDVKKPKAITPLKHTLKGIQQWITDGGSTVNTKIKEVNGIRGSVGDGGLKKGDLLMRIPSYLIIYSNYVMWTTAGRRCHTVAGSPQENLVYFVMNDIMNNASSQFHEYYDILPPDYSSHALHWSEEELKMFSGSHFLRRRKSLLKDTWFDSYQKMKECVGEPASNWTFSTWAWARTIVMSRNFNNGNLRALVPVGDLINHASSSESAKWSFDTKTRDFKLRATEHYRDGKPLSISYGRHAVKRFLLWYGFVDSESFIGRQECNGEYVEVGWNSAADGGDKLTDISYENLNSWISKLYSDTAERLPEETIFTQWVMTMLRSRRLAEKKLDTFSSTLEEDREIISRPGFSKRKTVSQGTLQEKQILKFLIKATDYVRIMLSDPTTKPKDFFEELQGILPVCTLVSMVEVLEYVTKAALS